jgi:hypothetical protein
MRFLALFLLLSPVVGFATDYPSLIESGICQWTTGPALIAAEDRANDRSLAMKDPTVVFDKGRWHVFVTIRPTDRPAIMEYLSFTDWKDANAAPRRVISLDTTYHCAPQVFYFRPQKKWFLIYQWADKTPGTGFFGPCYSTMEDVGKPETLTPPKMLFPAKPANVKAWIDFWVICDEHRAYLFFTGDDGRFWRSQTELAAFPNDWTEPKLLLELPKNDFFEATHTYRLKGLKQYLTLVEAIGPGDRRYYKAYVADSLDGNWKPLADSWDKPFASIQNVRFAKGVTPWTDAISHGELLRESNDETLTVDPDHLRFLFQGCTKEERTGKGYGLYPWRLGLLEAVKAAEK